MRTLRPVSLTRLSMHRLSGKSLLIRLAFGLLVAGSQAAMGQAGSKERQPECQADSQSSADKDRQAQNGRSESEISRCKGVLTPPPTGDRGLVEPAPSTDNMPVIRPGDTPQQLPGPEQQ